MASVAIKQKPFFFVPGKGKGLQNYFEGIEMPPGPFFKSERGKISLSLRQTFSAHPVSSAFSCCRMPGVSSPDL